MRKRNFLFLALLLSAPVSVFVINSLFGKIINDNSSYISNDSFHCRAADLPKQDISSNEEKDLIYMREEEKLAHDFYCQMYDKWGLRPFNNIKYSEERHMSAIKSMLDKYSLQDPVSNYQLGVFKNSDLDNLYRVLFKRGSESELEALKSAAEIEEVDIKDLMNAIKLTDNDDLKIVYTNLLNASENHLRAFVRNMKRRGSDYTPLHLELNYFNEIING